VSALRGCAPSEKAPAARDQFMKQTGYPKGRKGYVRGNFPGDNRVVNPAIREQPWIHRSIDAVYSD